MKEVFVGREVMRRQSLILCEALELVQLLPLSSVPRHLKLLRCCSLPTMPHPSYRDCQPL